MRHNVIIWNNTKLIYSATSHNSRSRRNTQTDWSLRTSKCGIWKARKNAWVRDKIYNIIWTPVFSLQSYIFLPDAFSTSCLIHLLICIGMAGSGSAAAPGLSTMRSVMDNVRCKKLARQLHAARAGLGRALPAFCVVPRASTTPAAVSTTDTAAHQTWQPCSVMFGSRYVS